jgi:hypothetical protein
MDSRYGQTATAHRNTALKMIAPITDSALRESPCDQSDVQARHAYGLDIVARDANGNKLSTAIFFRPRRERW